MMSFLVTSKARRRVLELLWGNPPASGSCTDLAARAGVGFANAYRELHAMKELGLVATEYHDGSEIYRANEDSPDFELMTQLVARRTVTRPRDARAEAVRARLRVLGAPLAGGGTEADTVDEEDALADAVQLAHYDAAVARVFPLCLWLHRDHLDLDRLVERARRDREKHALGLLLDLTSEVSGDPRFSARAAELRDRRLRRTRSFFYGAAPSRRAREQAERNTPAVARRWGFRMNMDLESFRTLFEKFADAPPVHA